MHATQERLIFDNAFKEDTIEVARYDYKVKMPSTIDFGAALVTDFNFSLSVEFWYPVSMGKIEMTYQNYFSLKIVNI